MILIGDRSLAAWARARPRRTSSAWTEQRILGATRALMRWTIGFGGCGNVDWFVLLVLVMAGLGPCPLQFILALDMPLLCSKCLDKDPYITQSSLHPREACRQSTTRLLLC